MIAFLIMVIILCAGRIAEDRYYRFVINLLKEEELKRMELVFEDFDSFLFTKKRLKKMNQCLLLLLVIPFVKKKTFVILICFILVFLVYKIPYFRRLNQLKKMEEALLFELSVWMAYLITYLYQDVLYIALVKSKPFVPGMIRKQFDLLCTNLHDHPNDLNCFDSLMQGFEIEELNQMISLLKQSSDPKQFEALTQVNMQQISRQRKKKQEVSMFIYQWIGLVPLFSITIVYLIIMADLITNSLESGVI